MRFCFSLFILLLGGSVCAQDWYELSSITTDCANPVEKLRVSAQTVFLCDSQSLQTATQSLHFPQHQIIKLVPNPKQSYLAIFLGTSESIEMAGTRLEYAVSKLVFWDLKNQWISDFRPIGELYFSDWYFPLWSPRGDYLLLPTDHYGPFHLVEVKNLKNYLDSGCKAGKQEVQASSVGGNETAKVHEFLGWKKKHSFEFSVSCCDHSFVLYYQIKKMRWDILWEGTHEEYKNRDR